MEREKQKLMLSIGEPDLSRGIAQQIVGDSYRWHLVDVANNVQKVTIPTLQKSRKENVIDIKRALIGYSPRGPLEVA